MYYTLSYSHVMYMHSFGTRRCTVLLYLHIQDCWINMYSTVIYQYYTVNIQYSSMYMYCYIYSYSTVKLFSSYCISLLVMKQEVGVPEAERE